MYKVWKKARISLLQSLCRRKDNKSKNDNRRIKNNRDMINRSLKNRKLRWRYSEMINVYWKNQKLKGIDWRLKINHLKVLFRLWRVKIWKRIDFNCKMNKIQYFDFFILFCHLSNLIIFFIINTRQYMSTAQKILEI